jgi:RND superfamily putative drug exporter
MRFLGTLPIRAPRRTLVVVLAAAIVAAIVGSGTPARLSNSEAEFLSHETESYDTARLIRSVVGREPEIGVIFPVGKGSPDGSVLATIQKVATLILHPFYSRDGRSAAVIGYFHSGVPPEPEAVRLAQQFKRYLRVAVGGTALAGQELDEQIAHDVFKAGAIALPLLLLLGFVVFRSVTSAVLPALVGALAFTMTLCALRPINAAHPLSIFSLNIVTGLAVGLSIDYSLLLVSRFREELSRGREVQDAIVATISTAGRTIMFSAATVAAAFASLLVFPLGVIRSVAIGGVLVAGIACAVSLAALPAMFALLGHNINALAPEKWQRASERASYREEQGAWYRLARFVVSHPVRIAMAATLVLAALGLPAIGMRLIGFDSAALPTDTSAHKFEERVRAEFTHPLFDEIIVALHGDRSELRTVIGRYMEKLPNLQAGLITELRPELWELNIATAGSPFSNASTRLVREIRAIPAKLDVTGVTADYIDTSASLRARLPVALLLLTITTAILLMLATGSVLLPFKTLIMNLLSLSAAFGLLVVIFQDGRFEGLLQYRGLGGLALSQPIVLGAGTFGILTDYGTFLLTRIREGWDAGLSNREAIVLGVERTGRIITAAALLFCVAVGALLTARVTFVKEVGLGTAAAVAIDATIVRALLVPSLMTLLGKWNWWRPTW